MSTDKEKKINRCRFSHLHFKGDYSCLQDGFQNSHPTDEEKCEACSLFKSRYIEFPIQVNETVHEKPEYNKDTWHGKMGSLVKIRPCGEEYENKTYIGFYLGDLPLCTLGRYDEKKGVYKVELMNNPAIFVPKLGKIIFGCESWWGVIKSIEEIKDITDDDISKVWYVKLAKALKEK